MKVREKQRARALRQRGWSINDIYKQLGVGKGSVSVWVRDIELTTLQKEKLSLKNRSVKSIEKRRISRLQNENARRQKIVDEAKTEFPNLIKQPLFLAGVSLYWAEGSKTKRGTVEVVNGDPKIIQVAMKFFRDTCNVPEGKFRGHIHIHQHLDVKRAEKYWSEVSGIPLSQFIKTYNKPNRGSKNKKDTLPYGTCAVYICDTELFLKIKGWTEGMAEYLLKS